MLPVRGVAQPGSALRSGRRGPQFKSGHPDWTSEGRLAPLRSTQLVTLDPCGPCMPKRTISRARNPFAPARARRSRPRVRARGRGRSGPAGRRRRQLDRVGDDHLPGGELPASARRHRRSGHARMVTRARRWSCTSRPGSSSTAPSRRRGLANASSSRSTGRPTRHRRRQTSEHDFCAHVAVDALANAPQRRRRRDLERSQLRGFWLPHQEPLPVRSSARRVATTRFTPARPTST